MSKKQQVKVGTFLLEQEDATSKIKVTHESDHFSFRIWIPQVKEFFKVWTEKEHEKAYEMIFGCIMLFANFSLTNAIYFSAWVKWHNEFLEQMRQEVKEATDEEHDAALAEVKDEYEMAEKASTTLAPTESVEPVLDSEGFIVDNVTYETARNTID